jgi:phosphoglycolate phosphatase
VAVPSREQASYVIGLGLHDALQHAAPGLPTERYPELAARYRHHYFAQADDVLLFDGSVAMLQALRARGHRLAVATGKSRRGLAEALKVAGIAPLFEATRTAEETASKPQPLMLHQLMSELGIAPERTLMVGDTTHDLQLAANAGTAAVAVSFGAHEPELLRELPHLAVLHSTQALHDWLLTHG